ncbi:MAG: c-type cytochrome [Fuerstiella sp.]|nr:c-type cytochrome [Fuerstiella sp.]MCP4858087.1 c-type cytochrome [Fuerstiella sp.]
MTNGNRKLLPLITLFGLCGLACSVACAADEIERRDDAPKPLSAEQSIKHFRLPDDLRIELVADEPLVADPAAIAFDRRGRLFVCELHGYNLEGHLDVQQLNKTGKLDTVVRRIPAGSEAREAAEDGTYGTVKLLTDTNGDGRMDRADVWADRLPPCHGLVVARGGVIVVCQPDILFLADRDGDGKAEIRETLFTGFGQTTMERSINNPRWGLDNWIYVSGGNAGGRINGPHLKNSVQIGTTDFRIKADGSAIEPVTGRTATFGQTMTDWGDRFLITTRSPALYAVPLPYRYLARNPYVPSPSAVANAFDDIRTYPASQPHPWRLERSQKKEWARYYGDRYGAAEATANGYFTSACGQLIYRANTLPEAYRDNLLCCEPSQNLIHRCLVERDGLRFKARRAPGEETSEFLTSTDQWFRPTNLALGPDGGIYVVDMYREIIEDYSAIPRYLQQQYGLIEGNDRGRIWRIVPQSDAAPVDRRDGDGQSAEPVTTSELVADLSNPNGWWRQTAQRLLIEHLDMSAVDALTRTVRSGATAQTRLHALYALDGLHSLTPSVVSQSLRDHHFAVRMHALRLSEPWLNVETHLVDDVRSLIDDPDPRVRLQLALTAGESRDPHMNQTLQQLADRDGSDEWMRAAILSSVSQSSSELLATILEKSERTGTSRRLLSGLASITGARHQDEQIASLLVTIAANDKSHQGDAQVACLTGLLEGLQRGKVQALDSAEGKQALLRLLSVPSAEVRLLALRVSGLVKLSDSPLMKAAFTAAAKDALDEHKPLEIRQAAVSMLASAPYETLAETAAALLGPRQPLELQLAGIRSLSSADRPAVVSVLLSNWSAFSPNVQSAVIDTIFGRANRISGLLDAIEQDTVSPQSLGSLHRAQLFEHSDPTVRQRATTLLAQHVPQKSRELFDRYHTALAGERDAAQGEAIFKKICAQCHRLGGQGSQVGPDLSAAQNRPDASFLLDMLQPSTKITAGYRTYVVADVRGRVFTGVLTAENATSVTLRGASDRSSLNDAPSVVDHTILRKDIEQMKSSNQSLMPENLEKDVSPQDAANLIAYLRRMLGPVPPPMLMLFDEEPVFVAALNEGAGTATLVADDSFSGTAALLVTPPQRYSRQIPGWKYRIRETPGLDEFRYIRFAWKTRGGDGVMIELADNGAWPSADIPLRRYYSGRNTTNWKATEVSQDAPGEWTVVTRDLWRDFGNFTLTGVAPTAMGGNVMFDRIELLRSLDRNASSE